MGISAMESLHSPPVFPLDRFPVRELPNQGNVHFKAFDEALQVCFWNSRKEEEEEGLLKAQCRKRFIASKLAFTLPRTQILLQ